MSTSVQGFTFEIGESRERNELITGKLREFYRSHLPHTSIEEPASAPLEVYVLDGTIVVGGLVGWTHRTRDWFELTVIWVDEALRGQGLGWALLDLAEEEARKRKCRYARLATSHFQAPAFYEKSGYSLYGKLENCPPGVTNYYFWKDLLASIQE